MARERREGRKRAVAGERDRILRRKSEENLIS